MWGVMVVGLIHTPATFQLRNQYWKILKPVHVCQIHCRNVSSMFFYGPQCIKCTYRQPHSIIYRKSFKIALYTITVIVTTQLEQMLPLSCYHTHNNNESLQQAKVRFTLWQNYNISKVRFTLKFMQHNKEVCTRAARNMRPLLLSFTVKTHC